MIAFFDNCPNRIHCFICILSIPSFIEIQIVCSKSRLSHCIRRCILTNSSKSSVAQRLLLLQRSGQNRCGYIFSIFISSKYLLLVNTFMWKDPLIICMCMCIQRRGWQICFRVFFNIPAIIYIPHILNCFIFEWTI